MATKIFVNLAVKDLAKSKAFFSQLGYRFNPQFTDENAACLIISEDHIYAMLLTEAHFKKFTQKDLADASKSAEVILALSADSRADVDKMADQALSAGGRAASEPQDHGFMYSRSFQDPDGHLWEVFYMDESAIPPG